VAHILVVEDDRAYSALLAQALLDEGHEVRCAAGPREALRSVDAYWPDLLITDWLLKDREVEIDGLDVAHHLQTIRPGTPIIFVTGMKRPLLEQNARGLWIYKVFEKPVDLDALLSGVRDALGVLEESRVFVDR
jgi:DNA-binding NtrC family response regulator